jgi:hypothetical protein
MLNIAIVFSLSVTEVPNLFCLNNDIQLYLRSFGILREVEYMLLTDVSGKPILPIFKD